MEGALIVLYPQMDSLAAYEAVLEVTEKRVFEALRRNHDSLMLKDQVLPMPSLILIGGQPGSLRGCA